MTEAGFFAQKQSSPTSLALVILLHAAVLAAVIMIKGPQFIRELHPRIARVRYPGTGTMVSFETTGTAEEAEAACEACRLIVHATSLGGVETSLERRARYASEREVGTPPTLIRLSVGLEHVDDLWADLAQALG